jgi:hypothetical protein
MKKNKKKRMKRSKREEEPVAGDLEDNTKVAIKHHPPYLAGNGGNELMFVAEASSVANRERYLRYPSLKKAVATFAEQVVQLLSAPVFMRPFSRSSWSCCAPVSRTWAHLTNGVSLDCVTWHYNREADDVADHLGAGVSSECQTMYGDLPRPQA